MSNKRSRHFVPFDALIEAGHDLPPDKYLPEQDLSLKLWETIHLMAWLGIYLENTDQLSDRALYRLLRDRLLRRPIPVPPEETPCTHLIDIREILKDPTEKACRRDGFKHELHDRPLPVSSRRRTLELDGPGYDRDSRLPRRQANFKEDGH